ARWRAGGRTAGNESRPPDPSTIRANDNALRDAGENAEDESEEEAHDAAEDQRHRHRREAAVHQEERDRPQGSEQHHPEPDRKKYPRWVDQHDHDERGGDGLESIVHAVL